MTLDDMLDRTPRIKFAASLVLWVGLVWMLAIVPIFVVLLMRGQPKAPDIGMAGVAGGLCAVWLAVVLVAVSAVVSRKGRT
jgi:hypothetical protein